MLDYKLARTDASTEQLDIKFRGHPFPIISLFPIGGSCQEFLDY